MKNRLVSLILGLALLPGVASAVTPSQRPRLPDYDKRQQGPTKTALAPAAQAQDAEARLKSAVPGVKITRNPIVGTPRFISAPRGYLTGPGGVGKGVSPAQLQALPSNDPHRALKAFINEHSEAFGHDASVLNSSRIRRDYVTAHNGLRTTVWEQTYDEIPVFEGVVVGHFTTADELVSVSDHFVPDAAAAAANGNPVKLSARPPISVAKAVSFAAFNVESDVAEDSVAGVAEPAGPAKKQVLRSPDLAGPAWSELTWLPLSANSMRLCWQVVLNTKPHGDRYMVLIDAESGEVMLRRNLSFNLTDASYNVYVGDSPTPFTPSHPTPLTNQPAISNRVMMKLAALSTNASPLGWIADKNSFTSGNNVEAFLDRNLDYQADVALPNGGAGRTFDFPLDLTRNPNTHTNASVVQMFYRANWFHDKTYALGFTENAGNYQVTNFNRGGVGDDPVVALTQAGADVGDANNAQFQVGPDGIPGYVYMYIWDAPRPARDGALDQQVVLHELAHGLSYRLVGSGIGMSTLQTVGLGEGWSDFYALALLADATDDPKANYTVGGYAGYQMVSQNYYYGIRRYPYAPDMAKSPLTFKDIDPRQASAHQGVDVSPVFGGTAANEVHNIGEVWCAMLWEMRTALVEKLGFDEGNETALQLVTDGLRLCPENPTFIEARDAIIEADEINTGGSNYDELWIAFAKRGLGASASSPASTTANGVIEAYDLPVDIASGPPDGILEVKVIPGPGSVLFAGDTTPIYLKVADTLPVTNATIRATVGTTVISFRNDGVSPDSYTNDNTYSGTFNVPTNTDNVSITYIVGGPGKTNLTNTVSYYVIPTPINDNFANASKITGLGQSYFTSNKRATIEKDEPNHAGVPSSSSSLWWNYSPSTNGPVVVDTGGSDFTTIVAVYTNNTLTNIQQVVSKVGSLASTGRKGAFAQFNAKAGVIYRIAVAGYNPTAVGTLRLRLGTGVQPDTNAPVATIAAPGSGVVVTTNRIVLSGGAVDGQPDPSGVKQVNVSSALVANLADTIETTVYPKLNLDGPVSTNWTAIAALRAGVNRISVTALDFAGNRSRPVSIDVVYRVVDPVNDFFANSTVITTNRGVSSVNTRSASKEAGEPNHAGLIGGKSAWWTYTAAEDGVLNLTTTNSSFDTVIAVYTGDKVSTLTPVASNDDAYPGVPGGYSLLPLAVRANQTYRIAVDGYDNTGGVLFLGWNFESKPIYRVLVNSGVGGTTTVSSVDVASNATITVSALATPGYKFEQWDGAVTSLSNPLTTVVRKDMTLNAVFALAPISDGFETGDLRALSWVTAGNLPWFVDGASVAAGKFAARSGAITHSQSSSLMIVSNFRSGVASFDYRVDSEPGWDRFAFYVDGAMVQQWSGSQTQWKNYSFPMAAGTHSLEWRYTKDNLNSIGQDAAFIDNVNLPLLVATDASTAATLKLVRQTDGLVYVELLGQTNQVYTLQVSPDMKKWTDFDSNVAVAGYLRFLDPVAPTNGVRYYRAVVNQ